MTLTGSAAPIAPWQLRYEEYERDLLVPDSPTQGTTGWFTRVSEATQRTWEQDEHPVSFYRLQTADIRDQLDSASVREVLAALGHPSDVTFESDGRIGIDALTARTLPLDRCARVVPFDGMRFVAYNETHRWDTWFIWNSDTIALAGISHYHAVRDALTRGEAVPTPVLLDYRDVLKERLNDSVVITIPTVRDALLAFASDTPKEWEAFALGYLLGAPAQDYAAAAATLARACPDRAVHVIARLASSLPSLLTADLVSELLQHGNAETRQRAIGAVPHIRR